MADTVRKGYRVHGRVQGVGFRWWTTRTAQELGLGGWVKNLRDGSVEIHACGAPEDLARFEERLRAGPPVARVDRIEAVDPDPEISEREFRVAY